MTVFFSPTPCRSISPSEPNAILRDMGLCPIERFAKQLVNRISLEKKAELLYQSNKKFSAALLQSLDDELYYIRYLLQEL